MVAGGGWRLHLVKVAQTDFLILPLFVFPLDVSVSQHEVPRTSRLFFGWRGQIGAKLSSEHAWWQHRSSPENPSHHLFHPVVEEPLHVQGVGEHIKVLLSVVAALLVVVMAPSKFIFVVLGIAMWKPLGASVVTWVPVKVVNVSLICFILYYRLFSTIVRHGQQLELPEN